MARKIFSGIVESVISKDSAVVLVESRKPHSKYKKIVSKRKSYMVNTGDCFSVVKGSKVSIMEIPPISKNKCWQLIHLDGAV